MVNTIFIILAYFIGSISFGILLSKIFKIQDPRSFGSKNPGATNVMRSGKKFVALLTLLGDMLKGTLVVLIAKYYLNFNDDQVLLIAAVVFIGHLFPVYYQFKGGKGVATALGVLLAIDSSIAIISIIDLVNCIFGKSHLLFIGHHGCIMSTFNYFFHAY
jgi:glycerol-3-phosphate acyltransferase PlsY